MNWIRERANSDSEAVIANELHGCLKPRNRPLILDGSKARSPCVLCNVKGYLSAVQVLENCGLCSGVILCKTFFGTVLVGQ